MTMGQLPVESLTLSEETRASLPGSFIALPLGVTHYQLGGPPSGRAVVFQLYKTLLGAQAGDA